MKKRNLSRAGRLGLVATVGLAATLTAAGPATALTPAAASVANNTLTITGTNGNDTISAVLDPNNANTLIVDLGDGTTPQSFDRTTFTGITVFLLGGNDNFTEGPGFADEATIIEGGNGNDTIVSGDGNDVILGEGGDDNITAGKGDDVIVGGNGNDFVRGGIGHDVAFLEGGDDSFQWNPGEGSDEVDGGSGNDRLIFIGAGGPENMSLSAVGHRAVFLRDAANIRMDLDNVEVLDLDALGGIDTMTVNDMTGTGFRQANIDLSGNGSGTGGDGANDVVTVNGTNKADKVTVEANGGAADVTGLQTKTHITGSEVGNGIADHLQVNTLDGNDKVLVDQSVLAFLNVTADLGPGQI